VRKREGDDEVTRISILYRHKVDIRVTSSFFSVGLQNFIK